jgi:hypothetical protein
LRDALFGHYAKCIIALCLQPRLAVSPSLLPPMYGEPIGGWMCPSGDTAGALW